jgi:hypothetical protein
MSEDQIEALALDLSSARTLTRGELNYCTFTRSGLIRFAQRILDDSRAAAETKTIAAPLPTAPEKTLILDAEISARTANTLIDAGLEYIDDAQAMGDGLRRFPRVGRATLAEVKAWKKAQH